MTPNKPDADKAAEEKYDKLLETVKIALSYRDFGVLNEYLKSIGEEKIASSQSGKERAALAFLVKVKEHKDTIGKDEWYEKNQPLAWEQARQALSTDVGEQDELKLNNKEE